MGMIVRPRPLERLQILTYPINPGEILEKSTRVLTPEEKSQLEIEVVGKNGQRRKLEVRSPDIARVAELLNFKLR